MYMYMYIYIYIESDADDASDGRERNVALLEVGANSHLAVAHLQT